MEEGGLTMALSKPHPWAAAKSNAATAIDELGKVREQIKTFESREKELVEIVKAMGDGEHAGQRCRAIVSTSQQARLDTTAVKEFLPDDVIARLTKTVTVTKVTIKPNF